MRLPATLSLRLRLLLAGTVAILVAVAVAAFGLTMLFRQHVESWVDKQLDAHMLQLISSLDRDLDGRMTITAQPAEPRFRQPFSGLYWEVDLQGGEILRSRSLWDQVLTLPAVPQGDTGLVHATLAGPRGEALYALQRRVILPARLGGQTAILAVAIDDREVRRAVWNFAAALVPFLLTIGVLLAAAAWVQVRVGLKPLERIQGRLSEIRLGNGAKLGAAWPQEVQPLVGEIDSLLHAQEQRIAKARARAADLAHGLKTPLQVIRAEARRLAARGERDAAANLDELVTVMSRHVERQMVRARLGDTSANTETELAATLDQVIRIIKGSPTGASLDWHVDVPPGLAVRIDPDDLVEALGNLIENAAHHARQEIRLAAERKAGYITIRVADDGPGIPPEALDGIVERGVRLDTSSTGAGLGLAIVQDIAEAWDGALDLENSDTGFIVCLSLRAAGQAQPDRPQP